MNKLILENFRCFRARHEIPIRPLTLLVGENSTGKSTVLAAIRAAADLASPGAELNLNEEPFNLGAYDQIASYGGGKAGRASHFVIGFEADMKEEAPVRLVATFRESGGQPAVAQLAVRSRDVELVVESGGRDGHVLVLRSGREEEKFPIDPKLVGGRVEALNLSLADAGLWGIWMRETPDDVLSGRSFDAFQGMLRLLVRSVKVRPYAIAPMRTKPERTYDPRKDTPRPQGDHVPMVLARSQSGTPGRWRRLRKRLAQFGAACGLFTSVSVRRLGSRSAGDPFQITVKVSGPAANLVDVGYGVSQVLPILVDSVMGQRDAMFLMQQPEVHLHPRAQAELGTFLGYLAAEDKKRFVVETHSDYLIDRIRYDIRDQTSSLSCSDVIVLYFERKGSWVTVHPIEIDEDGNLHGVPDGYRDFFLREQARLFRV